MSHERRDEFYVGYHPLPWGHSRFLRVAVPVMLWVMAVVAGIAAWRMHNPGAGTWDTAAERTWTGIVRTDPVPMLQIEGAGGEPELIMVVEMGKLGGGQRLEPYVGQWVTLRGYLLEREGRRMIELLPTAGMTPAITEEDDAVAIMPHAEGVALTAEPEVERLGEVDLVGEILDAKCYLGAMKPGSGKAHRACAQLCIRGGIPAMFYPAPGQRVAEPLVVDFGEFQGDERQILDAVGLRVRLRGDLERHGGIWVVRPAGENPEFGVAMVRE